MCVSSGCLWNRASMLGTASVKLLKAKIVSVTLLALERHTSISARMCTSCAHTHTHIHARAHMIDPAHNARYVDFVCSAPKIAWVLPKA